MKTQAVGVEQFALKVKTALTTAAFNAAEVLTPTPKRVVLVAPGALVAFDDCCDGQVWARLDNIAPTQGSNPANRSGMHGCSVPHFLATMELGVTRCAHTVSDRGKAPSAAQITSDGEQSIDDMAALLGVLRCLPDIRAVVSWTPQGPEGGCHGGFWTYNMLLTNCIGCEEVEEVEEGEDG